MIRAGVAALALITAVACGKYGPPVRSAPEPKTEPPTVSAAPAAGDTEECADPNAPENGAGQAP